MSNKFVLAGFSAIGKTTLARKYKNVYDLESSDFRWDNSGLEDIPKEKRKGLKRKENVNWPQNYIDEILKKLQEYDIVLIWVHYDILDILDEKKIPFIICFPEKQSLDFYRERCIKRGNSIEHIERIMSIYDNKIQQSNKYKQEKYFLKDNETLEDFLLDNKFRLIKYE